MACFLVSCTENVFVHSFSTISEEGWRRTDTLVFPIPASPTAISGKAYVEVRFDNSFPYEELWLEVETAMGDRHRCDTIRCLLGEKNGRGFNLLQYEHLAGDILLQEGDTAFIRVHHLMECEIVPHLREVGIRVEKTPHGSALLSVPARINTQEDEQQNGESPE